MYPWSPVASKTPSSSYCFASYRVPSSVVATQAGMTAPRVSYLLHLTRLGPTVVRAVLTGTIDEQVTIKDLHKAADHLDWSLQAAALNIEN